MTPATPGPPVLPFPAIAQVHTVVFDFDGVFTDNKVWVNQHGEESVRCDRRDGLAFDVLRALIRRGAVQTDFFILTKEGNPVVLARAKKLRLACHHGVGNKLGFLEQHLSMRGAGSADPFAGLIYVGNDLNDLAVMRRASFAVAPHDAHPLVRGVAHLVMDERGGDGFVRAFMERLLGIDRMSNEQIEELLSHG